MRDQATRAECSDDTTGRTSRPLAIIGFVTVLVAVVATLAIVVFSKGIRQVDWMDHEVAAIACLILLVMGTAIGLSARRHPLGGTASAIGAVALLGFAVQLIVPSGSGGGADPVEVQRPPSVDRSDAAEPAPSRRSP